MSLHRQTTIVSIFHRNYLNIQLNFFLTLSLSKLLFQNSTFIYLLSTRITLYTMLLTVISFAPDIEMHITGYRSFFLCFFSVPLFLRNNSHSSQITRSILPVVKCDSNLMALGRTVMIGIIRRIAFATR